MLQLGLCIWYWVEPCLYDTKSMGNLERERAVCVRVCVCVCVCKYHTYIYTDVNIHIMSTLQAVQYFTEQAPSLQVVPENRKTRTPTHRVV